MQDRDAFVGFIPFSAFAEYRADLEAEDRGDPTAAYGTRCRECFASRDSCLSEFGQGAPHVVVP